MNAIIPDILIHNFAGDDIRRFRTACFPAIIDVKTLRVDKRGSIYTTGVHGGRTIKKAVEKKSDQVRTDCKTRVGKLDDEYATNNTHKPFTTAYANTFATGGVMPVICGAFGEMNVHTHRNTQQLAEITRASHPRQSLQLKGAPTT